MKSSELVIPSFVDKCQILPTLRVEFYLPISRDCISCSDELCTMEPLQSFINFLHRLSISFMIILLIGTFKHSHMLPFFFWIATLGLVYRLHSIISSSIIFRISSLTASFMDCSIGYDFLLTNCS